jgi:hypothetical protein
MSSDGIGAPMQRFHKLPSPVCAEAVVRSPFGRSHAKRISSTMIPDSKELILYVLYQPILRPKTSLDICHLACQPTRLARDHRLVLGEKNGRRQFDLFQRQAGKSAERLRSRVAELLPRMNGEEHQLERDGESNGDGGGGEHVAQM